LSLLSSFYHATVSFCGDAKIKGLVTFPQTVFKGFKHAVDRWVNGKGTHVVTAALSASITAYSTGQ